MGKTRASDPIVRTREVKDALADAITRAIFKASPSLLREFRGDQLKRGCRRLAIHVVQELQGDGWFERAPEMGFTALENAVSDGMSRAGDALLRAIPDAHVCDHTCLHACDRKLIDGLGAHLGAKALAAMQKADVGIERRARG